MLQFFFFYNPPLMGLEQGSEATYRTICCAVYLIYCAHKHKYIIKMLTLFEMFFSKHIEAERTQALLVLVMV